MVLGSFGRNEEWIVAFVVVVVVVVVVAEMRSGLSCLAAEMRSGLSHLLLLSLQPKRGVVVVAGILLVLIHHRIFLASFGRAH